MAHEAEGLAQALRNYQRLVTYLRRTTNPEEWATHGDWNRLFERGAKALDAYEKRPREVAQLTQDLTLTERPDGWWLYDKVRGENLVMAAPSERAAFVRALGYYQQCLPHDLQAKVDAFVAQFVDTSEED
ncbi:MAG: hypothetical protein GX856_00435 [Gammaproteobacteria bacterium]|nr:hypothetical protein [Gammaproteobacteria bacterium]